MRGDAKKSLRTRVIEKFDRWHTKRCTGSLAIVLSADYMARDFTCPVCGGQALKRALGLWKKHPELPPEELLARCKELGIELSVGDVNSLAFVEETVEGAQAWSRGA